MFSHCWRLFCWLYLLIFHFIREVDSCLIGNYNMAIPPKLHCNQTFYIIILLVWNCMRVSCLLFLLHKVAGEPGVSKEYNRPSIGKLTVLFEKIWMILSLNDSINWLLDEKKTFPLVLFNYSRSVLMNIIQSTLIFVLFNLNTVAFSVSDNVKSLSSDGINPDLSSVSSTFWYCNIVVGFNYGGVVQIGKFDRIL